MWYYTLLPKFWNMSLTASVVILVVLLARLALKRAPKVFSYALWAVVLFRLLCPVSLPSGLSLFSVLNAPVSEQNTLEYVPPDIVHAEDPEVDLPVPGVSEIINETLPYGLEQQVADPLETPVYLATMLWLFGIAVLLLYSVVSFLRLRWKLVGSALLRDNIRLADRIASPFVLGLFRPKIYLPSSLPEGERDYIILHEQTHIRRLDHVVKLLSFAALCIHWFNPLVWIAFVLSGKDMEMSCDEAVLRKMGEGIRGDYSQSLLNLATGRRVIAGTPLAFGEGDTKSRVKNALKWKKPAVWIVFAAVIVCAAVILVCALNPKKEELPAPEPFGFSYSVEEIIYDDIRFSSLAPGTSLDYSFTKDHELLRKGVDWGISDWESMGALTEVKLTKSRFDVYFREQLGWTEGFSAAALRQNNQQAWQLLSDGDGYSYYFLLQKNGEIYLACWYYDEERVFYPLSDDSLVRCLLKLTKTELSPDASEIGGADSPAQVSIQADPLDAAVSAAILEHTAYENGNEWFHCESHVILGTQSSGGEHAEQLTVYAWALYNDYNVSVQGLTNMRGGSLPVALTFAVTDEDAYTLTEFWRPRDGAYYWEDIQEKFPASLWENVDGQKYILALTQACYAQAVEHSSLDTDAVIARLFETISTSPATSSNPGDYMDAHYTEHRELLYYGDYTLRYIFSQFFAGRQTDLKGHLMRIVMCELIGEEAIDLDTDTGQEYFDAWLAAARSVREEQGDAYVQEHMPKAWMLLQMVDSITRVSKPPAF